MNALIVAAGLGTRLRPLTDTRPKALVPVAGRPMLEHQILKLKACGFDHIVVNVHHFGQQIIDFIEENNSFGIRIDISDERGQLLDTGGAVRAAARFFTDGEPVLVLNVDIFSTAPLASLYEAHRASRADASLLVSERTTSRYLAFDTQTSRLVGWKNTGTGAVKSPFPEIRETLLAEQPESSAPYRWLAFAGIHIVSPTLFQVLADYGEVFSIIDFYLSATATHTVQSLLPPADFRLVDAGKPDTLPLAEELGRTLR